MNSYPLPVSRRQATASSPRFRESDAGRGGQTTNYRLVAIVGPTASGKSELAVQLAKKFNGEIISCDSRQVYRGLNIGTGKVPGKWTKVPKSHFPLSSPYSHLNFIYKSIPHHLIDLVNPSRRYSVAQFKKAAQKTIRAILKRGKLPILCGGTGQYIDAVVFDQQIPEVKPNLKLRMKLERQSADELFKKLMKLDPVRAKTIDPHNKRRLIRALEIIEATGKPVPPLGVILSASEGSHEILRPANELRNLGLRMTPLDVLWIGTKIDQPTLYKKIDLRLKQRLKQGMIKEIRNLHSPPQIGGVAEGRGGISWKKLESFGLEYKYISLYLQKNLSYKEMFTQLSFAIKHYSKRQMTWFKRNKEIHWIKPNVNQAKKLTKHFLSR